MSVIFRIFYFFTIFGLGTLLIFCWLIQQQGKASNLSFLEEHLDSLRDVIEDLMDELIPLDIHELKILTWKIFPLKTSKKVESGYIQTIFQERLITYALIKNADTSLLHASSAETAYTIEKRVDRNTKVFISDTMMGTIEEEKGFILLDDGKSLYKATDLGSQRTAISTGDKILAEVYLGNSEEYSSDSDRLFTLIYKMSDQERENLIVLILYLLLLKK